MADKVSRTSDAMSVRHQEVAPGEYAPEIYTHDAWSAAVALGQAYLFGTSRMSLTVAGNVRVLIANPTGSGVRTTIVFLGGLATATGWATTHRNPTTGLPTGDPGQVLRANTQVGAAPKMTLRADTNATTALSGGTPGPTVGLAGGSRIALQLGVLLFPGESLGLNDAFTGAADFAGSIYVIEEAL